MLGWPYRVQLRGVYCSYREQKCKYHCYTKVFWNCTHSRNTLYALFLVLWITCPYQHKTECVVTMRGRKKQSFKPPFFLKKKYQVVTCIYVWLLYIYGVYMFFFQLFLVDYFKNGRTKHVYRYTNVHSKYYICTNMKLYTLYSMRQENKKMIQYIVRVILYIIYYTWLLLHF